MDKNSTHISTEKARQADRGKATAKALIFALVVCALVLLGLELYGSFGPGPAETLATE